MRFPDSSNSTGIFTFAVPDRDVYALKKGFGPSRCFPSKLHQMLENAEAHGYQDIISWLPGGRAFKIHDPEGMVSVLPMFFNQTRYKSFLRQLQNYGFERVIRGPGKGICAHKLFVKGAPLLSLTIKRIKQNEEPDTAGPSSRPSPKLVAPLPTAPMTIQSLCRSQSMQMVIPSKKSLTCQGRSDKADIYAQVDDIINLNAASQGDSDMFTYNTQKEQQEEMKNTPDEDDAWLTKLFQCHERWMTPNSASTDSLENLFEPNHVDLPTLMPTFQHHTLPPV